MLDEADCLGPYVNEDVNNISALLYADDLVIGAESIGRLQKAIDVLSAFCLKWGLTVNLAKTKVMVFRNGGPLRVSEKWYFNGSEITLALYLPLSWFGLSAKKD